MGQWYAHGGRKKVPKNAPSRKLLDASKESLCLVFSLVARGVCFWHRKTKRPLTCVSKPVPGVHGKRGLERGWQKRLAKGWRKVGEGLAKGWRRVSGFPCTLHFRNSWNARLETLVCDSMGKTEQWHLRGAENVQTKRGAKTPFWRGVSFVRVSCPLFFPSPPASFEGKCRC